MSTRSQIPEMIFVGGLHRSGTSVLARCLGQHPRISKAHGTGVPEDEGQHLQSVYPPALAFGGPGRFAFAPDMHLTEESPLVSTAAAERLWGDWSPHWDPSRPIFLEKSPPNLLKTRFLQALFPGSRFIVLLRHPLAVAYATQKWSHTPLESLLEHWLTAHEIFDEDRVHLNQVLVVRYEDLTAEPEAVLHRIYRFLGVEPISNASMVKQQMNADYFSRWAREHAGLLGHRRARRLLAKFEKRVARFGYSLRDPEVGAAWLGGSVSVGGMA